MQYNTDYNSMANYMFEWFNDAKQWFYYVILFALFEQSMIQQELRYFRYILACNVFSFWQRMPKSFTIDSDSQMWSQTFLSIAE